MGLGWLALVAAGSFLLADASTLFGQVPLYPGQPRAIRLLSTAAGQPIAVNLHAGLCGVASTMWVLVAAASLLASTRAEPAPMSGTTAVQVIQLLVVVLGGVFWVLQAGFHYKVSCPARCIEFQQVGNGECHTVLAACATFAGMAWMCARPCSELSAWLGFGEACSQLCRGWIRGSSL